jgi:chemotaxis protein MotB
MKKKRTEKENGERWLLTYSDLITLLMIFFIIMYASSNVDTAKYKAISQSFNQAMGGGKNIIKMGDNIVDTTDTKLVKTTPIQPIDTSAQVEQSKLEAVKKQLDKYLKDNNLSNSVVTDITERGLEASFLDSALFDSGKADIKPETVSKIIEIGKIVNQLGNYIRIEGHTDNVPIKTNQFASNWQLSAIRATNVTELLISTVNIAPEKISAVGYGDTRPKADNSTENGRAQNRRVNIVIINSKFNASEVNKPQ